MNKTKKQKYKQKKNRSKKTKNKLKGGAGDKFTKDKLNNILIRIVSLLHQNKLKNWFIGYGTLLGITRKNSCIDYDDDIDIVIDKNDRDKLHDLINKNKFKFQYNKPNFCKIVLEENMPTVDFYLSDVVDNNFNDTWEKVTWSNPYPLVNKKFNNINLNLPNNYYKKLENRYGKDWRSPKYFKGKEALIPWNFRKHTTL